MIEVNGLAKRYGGFTAMRDLSFSVRPGEVLGPALLVLGAHDGWVVRSVVSFEEASIERAARHAARVAAIRSGERRPGSAPTTGRPGPFVLADTGRPELAFLWKNLLSTWSWLNVRVWAALAVLCGELWLGLHVLGKRFAQFDLSAELRP